MMELSEREVEVLKCLAEGMDNNQIAETLMVSVHTVKAHLCSIFAKLKVNGRVQAAVRAIKLGII